uniref:RNA-dependent RNA polymerase n=1 Tax=Gergich narna-like virus TaxID=2716641 RepID=A0A6G7PSN0_9VIRU|nr:RNA-dependent RNA polymerase [Gergich narna-like virus]
MTAKTSSVCKGRGKRGNNSHLMGIGRKFTYLAHLNPAIDVSLVDMFSVYDIPEEVSDKCITLIQSFLGEFQRIATHLGKPDNISEFYDACKARFQDLTKLNGVICTDAKDLEEVDVYVTFKQGSHLFDGRWSRSTHVYGLDNDEVLELWAATQKPGCYKWLYLADLYVLSWASSHESDDYDSWQIAEWVSTIVCSIGRVYEDMRPNAAYAKEFEQKSLARLKAEHDLDHSSEWYQVFMQVADDIRCRRDLPYIRDINLAIAKSGIWKIGNDYSYRDFHLSFRKTGSTFKDISYPGLYASLYEYDIPTDLSRRFDEFTGYQSHYNKEASADVHQPIGHTITIEQHKIDRRVIHMGPNPVQDRLNYVHRRIQRFLNLLPEDCTTNQSRGVDFAMRVTAPQYRSERKRNIYSLDISKATDTIDLEFQKEVLRVLLPDEIVDYWIDISTSNREFVFFDHTKEEYVQTCGQAQGYKSSFPAFAWSHHFLMRMLMKKFNLEMLSPRDFYRVLGDDSIISVYDPEEKILDGYINVCQWINWSTNRSKGYIAHWDQPYAFAEFAKKRVLNGVVNTPIPIQLMLNAETSCNATIGLFQWISLNYRPIPISKLYDISPGLNQMYSEDEINILRQIARSGISSAFSGWTEFSEPVSASEPEQLAIIASVLVTKLRSTLVDQLLPDYIREVAPGGFDEHSLEWLMNTDEEEILFDEAKDPDNKYYQVLNMNSEMIDYIKHILGDGGKEFSPSITWSQLQLSLTEDEENSVFNALECVENIVHSVPMNPESCFLSVKKALDILERFNPRGDSRVTFENGTMWTAFIVNYKKFLPLAVAR